MNNNPCLDLTIGLSSVTMRAEMEEVSVGITFSNGTLKPDNIANLFLQIRNLEGIINIPLMCV